MGVVTTVTCQTVRVLHYPRTKRPGYILEHHISPYPEYHQHILLQSSLFTFSIASILLYIHLKIETTKLIELIILFRNFSVTNVQLMTCVHVQSRRVETGDRVTDHLLPAPPTHLSLVTRHT